MTKNIFSFAPFIWALCYK